MKSLKILFLIGVVALTGCTVIQTSSTTFHGAKHEQRGQISVLPLDASQTGSLEFSAVSEYLLKKFAETGYSTIEMQPSADYVAFITYGIDSGQTSSTTVPIYGQTGGGTSYSSGTVSSGGRYGTYSGTTTTMPTYGMVGAVPVQSTVYKRVVNIDVYRKNQGQQPLKVYEMKGVSAGSCGNINMVLFHIIDGMFKNFPGVNGQTKLVEVPFNKDC